MNEENDEVGVHVGQYLLWFPVRYFPSTHQQAVQEKMCVEPTKGYEEK